MSPAPGTPVRTVEIVEVAPRDGLQSDPTTLPTATKVELITRAVRAGLRRVEAVSFVNPRRVPQMADADQVMAALRADTETRALGASYIGIVVAGARAAGILTSVTVTASFGCPYEGEVDPDRLAEVLAQVAAMQPGEVALADSIGVAVPADVSTRVALARDVLAGSDVRLRCHFHNTRNTGLANALAAVDAGVGVLDSSLGGIGGCPFAPHATGNIPTEDLVYLLHRSGLGTSVDLAAACELVPWLEAQLGHSAPGYLAKAGIFPDVALGADPPGGS